MTRTAWLTAALLAAGCATAPARPTPATVGTIECTDLSGYLACEIAPVVADVPDWI